jgi:hypothetical protein
MQASTERWWDGADNKSKYLDKTPSQSHSVHHKIRLEMSENKLRDPQ